MTFASGERERNSVQMIAKGKFLAADNVRCPYRDMVK